jgi:Ca-activated chloride channel family protein
MGRFGRQSAIVAALLSVIGLALAQEPVFYSSSKLVRLIVTVKNERGDLVGDLRQQDFRVFDSGVEQTIRVFERHTEVPLSISILIDTSGSTRKDLDSEVAAIRKFLGALVAEGNPQDSVAIYSFNHEVTLLTSFTRNPSRLNNALRRLKANSGTSLYDAVYLASRQIEDREGRHIMVIVTDGGDTTSRQTFLTALRAAQQSEVVIYPILVTPITTEPGRNLGGERVLAQFASNTGGFLFEPAQSSQLDAIFTQLLRDLRTQYLLAFRPENLPQDLPEFHPIRVEVLRAGLRVSTRSGYYESTARR